MTWNQISENILCNSEYYVNICNDVSNNDLLYDNLVNQRTYFRNYFTNTFQFFSKYCNINIGNLLGKNIDVEINRRNLVILYNDNNTLTSAYANIKYRYHYDCKYNGSTSLIGKKFLDNKNRKCDIVNVDLSNNIITLKTPLEPLFHFSFHTRDMVMDREDKGSGAFHIKIDKMLISTKNDIQHVSPNYRPFILTYSDIIPRSFVKFEEFDTGKLDGYYTTKNMRVRINELQLYLLRNKNPNGNKIIDSITYNSPMNGKQTKSYIYDIIAPMYNHIVEFVLNPILTHSVISLPLAKKIGAFSQQDINDASKVYYCSTDKYADSDIQDQHDFKTTVLHGGNRFSFSSDKKTRKKKFHIRIYSKKRR